jgi:cell division protein FtsA
MFIRNREDEAIVAVDIGTSKVAVAVAKLERDGKLVLMGVGEAGSAGMRKGEIYDFDLLRESIVQAVGKSEELTDAEIASVYLAMNGSHIESLNLEIKLEIEEEDYLIVPEHLEELDNRLDPDLAVPRDHHILQNFLQHYTLDNGMVCHGSPVGKVSKTLSAHYHIIHGQGSRLVAMARCVADLGLALDGCVHAGYTMSQAVLNQEQKKAGALAVDLGAGLTTYVLYIDGSVMLSGALPLGGEHLTNDLSIGLGLPYMKAEQLKREHGVVAAVGVDADEQIVLPRDASFEERAVYRASMVDILEARQREIFEWLHEEIDRADLWSQIQSVHLTGGGSLLTGVDRLAEEVFPAPVQLFRQHRFEGEQTYSHRPDLSVVLGLLVYAQRKEMEKRKRSRLTRFRESVMNLLGSMRLL